MKSVFRKLLILFAIQLLLLPVMQILKAQDAKTHSIYFNFASYTPDTTAVQILDSIAQYCLQCKAVIVSITGYCDSVGTRFENYELSVKRANITKIILMQKGVRVNTIVEKGKSETEEFSGDDFYRNRRVEIVTAKPSVKKEFKLAKQIADAKPGDHIILENISFYPGLSRPRPESADAYEELYLTMVKNPQLVIAIEGHVCCMKDDIWNLSGERAKSIYDYLLRKGIAANRLTYKGFGHTRPLTEERSEEERQMNRRVEIRVVKK